MGLAMIPALPEPATQAARAKAGERDDAFVTALGHRLAEGAKLRQEIAEDVPGAGVDPQTEVADCQTRR